MREAIDARSLKLVKQFAPDLNKKLNRELNTILGKVVDRARGFVPAESPMSGWTPATQGKGLWASKAFDQTNVQRGITKTRAGRTRHTREGWASSFAILDRTAAGVIYESAGTRTSGRSLAGRQFIQNIANRSGIGIGRHRMIVEAVIEMRPTIRREIDQTVDNAIKEFNARMI